ncbi:hypothetical protein M409DRAFT_67582 [Zasmidium cellare ATCC 36951]|uniref:Peptidase S33 tripeptidyl aminopeptidase-like C-terminal domain-containing protein n=1 Tax=Zasmidium cellare ATCC 36951 TaxID=1080233 RepID=A0A6A6CG06_ZASCE|nr:uncharacterized protein M409DRAFT_67582 [Zasmidium cellare ATCC 36951]KAF2164862.1 hypothetical protein M409DRAFT_67582 [Zasmidium cellare ATCC 36951]
MPSSELRDFNVQFGSVLSDAFQWFDIVPEKHLVYHDCYDKFQCARLELLLDYNSTDADGPVIAVALIRLPAKVPVTDPRYGGPILINPGGPGGSGVERLLEAGVSLQNLADAERDPAHSLPDDKYFDMIGFDPRGINHTTPTITCFPDSISRQAWNLQVETEGLPGSREANMHMLYQRARTRSVGCSNTLNAMPGFENFGNHINTPAVVADMVEIVERHGEWREKEGRRAQKEHDRCHGRDAEASILQRTRHVRGEEPLLFWGFSYGTLLGATFAAMQPHRVSRIILDGVVNSDAYYSADRFDNLHDTDKILESFFHYCSKAGPEKCRFWREGGEVAIRDAYHRAMDEIMENPLPVPGNFERGPEIITYSNIKELVGRAMYQPLAFFPTLATLLDDVARRNGSVFAERKSNGRRPSYRTKACEDAGPYSSDCILPDWDVEGPSLAILCSEARSKSNISEPDFIEIASRLRNQSSALGEVWAQYLLGCTGWNATASWVPSGPITGNTSHPILWIGNTYDPVTPLRNAKKMAAKFPGSVVLQQDNEGHCSFSAPSVCTASAIRRYFQTGHLPDEGLVCETDEKPFIDVSSCPGWRQGGNVRSG